WASIIRSTSGPMAWRTTRMRSIPEEEREPITIEPARDEAACRTEFARVKARYLEIDQDKAKQTVPLLYAQASARLSLAEHNLVRGKDWREAAQALVDTEALIDTMWRRDTDGDGIVDLKDAAPLLPEDFDGFEDEDGAPDPDNDQDGIPDAVDGAPLEPETWNRWRDHDGVPDEYPEFENLLFSRGSTTISSSAKGYLRGIALFLNEWPELMVHLKGYTDNTHSTKYNMDLSRRRAQKVQQYLLEQGITEDRLIVSFHGEADPVSDNDTAAGRALNRRVEIVLE
ncbi:MAG: OmpA family protein, partial [Candidatus Hydrogenedentota bacterium]